MPQDITRLINLLAVCWSQRICGCFLALSLYFGLLPLRFTPGFLRLFEHLFHVIHMKVYVDRIRLL